MVGGNHEVIYQANPYAGDSRAMRSCPASVTVNAIGDIAIKGK